MTSSPSRLAALALSSLALGACTAAREPARTSAIAPTYTSLDATLGGRGSAAAVPAPARAATPVAVLPEWIGQPLHLRERDEADAFEQAVSLAIKPRQEARENLILLRQLRLTGSAADGAALGGRPTEAGIRAELAAVFPGTSMQVVARPASNAYGPYGLAIGRTSSGARCLYAWQWIAEAPALDPADRAPGPLSLRVRLCRDDITLEAMAAAVNQLKLVPRYAGTPLAVARPDRTGLAARRDGGATHAATGPRRPRPARRLARAEAAADAPVRAATADIRPPPAAGRDAAAPAPAPQADGRRYLGVVDAPAAHFEPARAATNGAATYGATSYGAPSYGAATYGAAPRGQAAGASPGPQADTLSADLPPEALRGPSMRPSGRL